MADEDRKKSFWETLPGIITALAALLTAVAAVIAALNGRDKESAPKPDTPAAQAKTEAAAALAREAEWKRKLAEANAARIAAAEEAAAAVAAARKALEEQRLTQGRTIGQYIDHGNGTITDTKSGLMWKRCTEGLSGVKCEEGEVKNYTWNDAVQRFKDVEYAGYSDWRLPTIDELKTLVYCSKGIENEKNGRCNDGSEQPTINQQAFPNTEAYAYWSGSPYADDSAYAWYVDFGSGYSVIYGRDDNYAVRLVRGGQ